MLKGLKIKKRIVVLFALIPCLSFITGVSNSEVNTTSVIDSNIISTKTSKTSLSTLSSDLTSFYNSLEDPSAYIYETDKFSCTSSGCTSNSYTNIGLLTEYEYNTIGGLNSYLATLNPFFVQGSSSVVEVTTSGIVSNTTSSNLRPVAYVESNVQVTGSGTISDPYILIPSEDLTITYTINNNSTTLSYDELLAKYVVEGITCKRGTTASWNYNTNELVLNSQVTPDYCTINFKDGYSVSMSGVNGKVGAPVTQTIGNLGTVTFTVTPNSGYLLNGSTVSCDGGATTNLNTSTGVVTVSNVKKSQACSVNFKKATEKLTLTKGTGVASIYYKINGATSYTNVTSDITLDVNTNSTYSYYGVASTGYTMNSCTESSPCSGTMTSALSATLSATLNKYILTLTKNDGVATIYYKVNGASSYASATSEKILDVNYGSTYYYYGVANTGYTMSGCTSNSPCSETMGTSAVKKTLLAALNKYTIKTIVNNSSYGSVSPESQTVEHGDIAEIYLLPNMNYGYDSVSCDGGATVIGVFQGVQLRLSNITQSQTCTVTYKSLSLALLIKSLVVTSGEGVYNENGYRYEGSNPNNYIKMKKSDGTYELWRIIGVFNDGTSGEEVVRVRRYYAQGSYPTMAYDSNRTNHWPNTTMYSSLSNTYTLANYANTVNFKMYLGTYSSSDVTVASMYTYERGSTAGKTSSSSYSSTVLFTGPVGLMYPSDYGYGVLASDCARTITLYNYDGTSACYKNNWLYQGSSTFQWLISPSAPYAYGAFVVGALGFVNYYGTVTYAAAFSPVMALKADTTVSGSGTYSDPYVVRQ